MAHEDLAAANLDRFVLRHWNELCRHELIQVVRNRNFGEPFHDIDLVAAGVEMDFVVVHDNNDALSALVVMFLMAVVMAFVLAVFTTALCKF
jgi:hypothetical protein